MITSAIKMAVTGKPSKTRLRLIGYARVSTGQQATKAQEIELKEAGRDMIIEEHGSSASRARPALLKSVREIGPRRHTRCRPARSTGTLG